MAIIATLKATEDCSGATVLSTASIPLNKLTVWEGNVRKTDSEKGLDELIASIAAHGVLQSLVVKKAARGKYSIIAGRRRYLALSALAEAETIAPDAPVPCRIVSGSADSAEISLTENVVRAPMHPADQFEAFRALVDDGHSVADIAARFGIVEKAVKQRLRLARVSPKVYEAYRAGDLTLEQVQAFAVTDDHAAQEQVFEGLADWSDTDDIRNALTQDDLAATDKRARFVTVAAYEAAGGEVRRDLFTEDDDGVFLLDPAILDHLVAEKLQAEAEVVKAEGWKWVEAVPEFDHEARSEFRVLRPEPLPLSEEAKAEQESLSEEYDRLFATMEEGNEETSERLDEIEARINELQDTGRAYSPETFAIAGAIVTLKSDGAVEILRGVVRPEDMPDEEEAESASKPRPEFSAALVQSLTEAKSAAISAVLAERPDIALAAVVHHLAASVFNLHGNHSCLQISVKRWYFKEESQGSERLEISHEKWKDRLPEARDSLWAWCLEQERETLLELLAHCAACTVNAVETKDRECALRIPHANALASALSLDMTKWFTPTKENYFSRVGRTAIVTAITEAKCIPAKKSWEKQKKAAFAAFAEREVAGTGWLPKPLKAA
jgi:ParB family transcriptional regulator, chromosome partitioning protein